MGCVALELFLGLPLFPGESELHMLTLINDMFGPFPQRLILDSPKKNQVFLDDFTMKNPTELCEENGETFDTFEHYFTYQRFEDLILNYCTDDPTLVGREEEPRELFIDLLKHMLDLDPDNRPTPHIAMRHQFFWYVFEKTLNVMMFILLESPCQIILTNFSESLEFSNHPWYSIFCFIRFGF